eukprot:Gb_39835 [translate_table: standard]
MPAMELGSCAKPSVQFMGCPRMKSKVEECDSKGREMQTVVSDLCGAMLRGHNPFAYFMLVSLEASGVIRSVALLFAAPIAWFLYHCVSASSAIKLMVYISISGLKVSEIEGVARAVLPKFFLEDINPEAWRVFSSFGRRVIVTAMPTILVQPFALEYVGVDTVIGTEIEVNSSGLATGYVKSPGVLTGLNKKNAVKGATGEGLIDVGVGKYKSTGHFLSLCKEAYIVHSSSNSDPLPTYKLPKSLVFHDGRLVQRPDPLVALITFLWMPVGFLISLIRITIGATLPMCIQYYTYWLMGVRIIIKGKPPQSVRAQVESQNKHGTMFVCSHRTLLDPIFLSAALGRPVSAVTYSISRLSEFLSPIPTVRLTRNRDQDALNISKILQQGDLVLCPEGTTCREPFLLRYSAMFAELTDHIVPVAINCRMFMFHGTSSRGWKAMDPFFFFMNPSPVYEITFLNDFPKEITCGGGGRTSLEVANSVQKVTAGTLGFECTNFTRRDKYKMLAGNDGSVGL